MQKTQKVIILIAVILISVGGVGYYLQSTKTPSVSTDNEIEFIYGKIPPHVDGPSVPLERPVITINDSTGELETACSQAVGDVSCRARSYMYRDDNLSVYFSFGPEVDTNKSLDSYKKNFNYLHFRLNFPELQGENEDAHYQNRDLIEEIHIESFHNGKLKGSFSAYIDKIPVFKTFSPCQAVDAFNLPKECDARIVPYDKTIRVEFEFTLPN